MNDPEDQFESRIEKLLKEGQRSKALSEIDELFHKLHGSPLEFKPRYYILDENNQTVAISNLNEWAQWFENNIKKRQVARTYLNGVYVSTVFLGLDYGWLDKKPILFETMVFENQKEAIGVNLRQIRKFLLGYQQRYSTWEEAVKGHEQIVTVIREGLF